MPLHGLVAVVQRTDGAFRLRRVPARERPRKPQDAHQMLKTAIHGCVAARARWCSNHFESLRISASTQSESNARSKAIRATTVSGVVSTNRSKIESPSIHRRYPFRTGWAMKLVGAEAVADCRCPAQSGYREHQDTREEHLTRSAPAPYEQPKKYLRTSIMPRRSPVFFSRGDAATPAQNHRYRLGL
jgi:hypothetical protein